MSADHFGNLWLQKVTNYGDLWRHKLHHYGNLWLQKWVQTILAIYGYRNWPIMAIYGAINCTILAISGLLFSQQIQFLFVWFLQPQSGCSPTYMSAFISLRLDLPWYQVWNISIKIKHLPKVWYKYKIKYLRIFIMKYNQTKLNPYFFAMVSFTIDLMPGSIFV